MPIVEREWEWHFAASPEALWPLVADTARIGEANGFPRYTVTDIAQPDGTVQRIGSARRLGMPLTWDEGVPEWVAGKRYAHERRFHSRLIRRLASRILLDPEEGGTRLRYRTTIEACWPVALLLRCGGMRSAGKTLDRLFRETARVAETSLPRDFAGAPQAVSAAVKSRVAAQAKTLTERGHAAAARLADHLLAAPETDSNGCAPARWRGAGRWRRARRSRPASRRCARAC